MSDDAMFRELATMNGPKLIDIGRGVVDAREVLAVTDIMPDDRLHSVSGSEPMPEYARSFVLMRGAVHLSPLASTVIVTRWRQALGGLPTPIGSED